MVAQVVSATTRFARGGVAKQTTFLAKASVLLSDAIGQYQRGEFEDSLESAYRAGLRTAGARVAASPVAKKVRKPNSVWEQLMLVDEQSAQWARQFLTYSRIRSRVASGLTDNLDTGVVQELISLVESFLDEVEQQLEGLAHAA
ncbi:Uncharacterised protein [Corynebacterium kutscheri]|uniref:SAV-6107-like HEPN domain-containing protein n=1 Tax=Corynebacterium kutscheri TaxID=35755 RepID=A0A0F6TDU1_9CORY|nr:SAV_6107 family HEPN domain-containing protein [Corynebacterium kutscheri]AKE41571.1 hypothetical protein UL82_07035 [Corynebacterium kutscheri]VEH08850.1 Uncharacterised protein [Corynebacterium kutscheri]VEH09895.1 Uncharacterised protein [Corynebacterium kutscheri]VEH79979.1 Uncharacterised protein [Corynebacterium kutscheri]